MLDFPVLRGARAALALVVASLLAVTGCRSSPQQAPPAPAAVVRDVAQRPLTSRQRELNLETFDVVWTTVRDRHYDPTLNGVDWPAVRERLRPKMEQAATMAQARAVLGEMLATLGQSHMAILPAEAYDGGETAAPEPAPTAAETTASSDGAPGGPRAPAAASRAAPRSTDAEAGRLGLDFRAVDGRALVFRVEPDSPAGRAGVRPGWELVSVGRREVRPVLNRVASMPTMAGVPLAALQAMAVRSLTSVDLGETVHLGFLDGQNRAAVVTLTADTPSGVPVRFGQLPTEYLQIDARRLPAWGPTDLPPPARGGIAYFSFNIWLDPVRVNAAFEGLLRDMDGAEGLVIDLRGNPGGLGAMAMGLGGYLVTQRNLVLGETKLRNGNQRFVLNPRQPSYTGPVAVLVDELSASTSEIFAGGLQDIGRARVFGTRTAGAALPSVIEVLPNGDRFQYVFANYVSASGRALEGQGVVPDEVVPLDRKSLLQGRDVVLDAARAWIRSQAPRTVTEEGRGKGQARAGL